jgi:hypothetical protein
MGYLSRPWKKAWGRAGAMIGLAVSLAAALVHYFVFGIDGSPELAAAPEFVLIAALALGYSLFFIPVSMFAIWAMSSDHLGN